MNILFFYKWCESDFESSSKTTIDFNNKRDLKLDWNT